LKFASLV